MRNSEYISVFKTTSVYAGNEGHSNEFELDKQTSLVAAALEVIACALLRQVNEVLNEAMLTTHL